MHPDRDIAQFRRDADLPHLELRYSRYNHFAFSKHAHDTFGIGVVLQGVSMMFGPEEDERLMIPGRVALLNPGMVHTGEALGGKPMAYRMMYLDQSWIRQLAAEMRDGDDTAPEFVRPIVPSERLCHRILAFHHLVLGGAERLEKQSAMFSLFGELLSGHAEVRWHGASGRESRAVRLTKEYLADNVTRKICLDELSEIAGLSRYHLLRVFKDAVGLPPHAFQTQRRIQIASRMLLSGRPIADVALETGFSDQSHFTRAFKQVMGITPRKYVAEE